MKIAVVTGASSGMGREFVRQISALYPDLDEIWVFARRQERMERLRDRCHTPLRIFAGNLLKKKICTCPAPCMRSCIRGGSLSQPSVRALWILNFSGQAENLKHR